MAWRANRLADVLAKEAAHQERVSASTLSYLRAARVAYANSIALLGRITHLANHHPVQTDEGVRLVRDSAGKRPARTRGAKRAGGAATAASRDAAEAATQAGETGTHPPPTHLSKAAKRAIDARPPGKAGGQ